MIKLQIAFSVDPYLNQFCLWGVIPFPGSILTIVALLIIAPAGGALLGWFWGQRIGIRVGQIVAHKTLSNQQAQFVGSLILSILVAYFLMPTGAL